MLACVESAAYLGISAYPIKVEVDVAFGLPNFIVVGLPDTTVRESRERVRSAIKNTGYRFPSGRVIINLAPADIKKEGPAFDLPIAIGILAANDIIPQEKLRDYLFLGELALDGSLRPFKGAIVITSFLKHKKFILPKQVADEASLEPSAIIYPAQSLKDVIDFLLGINPIEPIPMKSFHEWKDSPTAPLMDFSEIKGQFFAKRAVEIAVAGGHNLLLIGPPGAGKTMLASRIPGILPALEFEEAIEITKIHSVSHQLDQTPNLIRSRPFRSPHHSTSLVGLIGGGSWPKPGEISLSHGGVLFLDEFPEFRRDALEALRSPLEEGEIDISRAKMQVSYPSRFLLVAAMNPCPCGYLGHPKKSCRCSMGQIQKYQTKISGPILDRIDLHVEVSALSIDTLTHEAQSENSESIRQRILACRDRQKKRYRESPNKLNALMRPREIKQWARPCDEGKILIEQAVKELHFSARAYFKILKIARTIADLAECETIQVEHLAEAIQYRSLDRQW